MLDIIYIDNHGGSRFCWLLMRPGLAFCRFGLFQLVSERKIPQSTFDRDLRKRSSIGFVVSQINSSFWFRE